MVRLNNFPGSAAVATLVSLLPVAMGIAAPPFAEDSAALAGSACQGASIAEDIQPLKVSGGRGAVVICHATERVANNPVRVRARCEKSGVTWSCAILGKDLTLPINGRATTVQFDGAYNSWVVYDIARHAAISAIPNANPAVKGGDRAVCTLTGDTTDTPVSIHDLRCDGWSVRVARLCINGDCRNEIMSRFFEPEKHLGRKR